MEITTVELVELLKNPFYLAEMLTWTASNYIDRKMSIYESYLIAPLVFNSDFRNIFLRTKKTGRIHSLFEGKEYSLYSFEVEVKYYKKNVDDALVIMLNKSEVSLDRETSELIIDKSYKFVSDKEYKKILKNIGQIFSKYRVEEIFNFLGVEQL